MKKTLTTWLIIALSFIAFQSWSQIAPTSTLTIKNITYTTTALEFDIYLQHTNPSATNFEYAAGQYFIYFNTAILNGGVGTYSILSSGLPTNMQPRSPSIAANVLRLAANVPPGAGLGFTIPSTSPGMLIVKMRVANSTGTLNTSVCPDLLWKDSGTAPLTTINAYIDVTNTNVTPQSILSVAPFTCGVVAPTAPVAGTPTQPTCTSATGSVVLSGLPATGSWTLNPGAIAGTGSSYTRSGLTAGTYSWTVTNANGTSPSSNSVVINAQPATPTAPAVGTITQPTCALQTGSVVLNGLPSGNWTINPGAIAGTGASKTITGLTAGTKNFTVTNAQGCTSPASANVVINAATGCGVPTAPVAGTPTQPTCTVATGSVVLSGLPATGTWTLNPGAIAGTGTSYTRSGLTAGTYSWTVSNANGPSASSNSVVINAQPATPSAPAVGTITQPTCALQTGSVVLNGLPSGNWTINPGAIAGTGASKTITGLTAGTKNFTVTNAQGCTSPASANVVINAATGCGVPTAPIAGTPTQPTCTSATGSVVLSGLPATGTWTLNPGAIAGTGTSYTRSGLTAGTYSWTVSNANGASPSSNSVVINAQPATPAAPAVGTITQLPSASVVLNGLPSGNWTINPGAIAGTGASKTITISAAGTYNYTVTNAQGCTSGASANVVINPITSTTNPTYTLKVKNIAYVSNGLEFDVYMVHTNPSVTNFEYAAGQYFLTFNTAILNGGTGTYSIVSSALPTNMQPRSPSVAANVLRLAANVPPGAGMGYNSISTTTPGTLICKMRLTSSTTLSQIDPTLVWKDAGTAPITTINAYVGTTNTTVTTPATHSVDPYVPQGTIPTAPVVGTITQPTCAVATGSVVLNGLPATGTWTINPGAIAGTGASKTITGLTAGTKNYTVSNANGTSPASANIVINAQPATPAAPAVGTITQPTCTLQTGSVVLNGLPSGNWTINPGAIAGTGASKTITGLTAGTKNFTVTNAQGCTSSASANVVINAATGCGVPTAPIAGTPTQPTCTVATGSVVLSGLPATGTWTLNPGAIVGSGTSYTRSGLTAGTYSWTVSNANGASPSSNSVVINAQPATPAAPAVGTITQLPSASVVLNGLPSGNWTINPGAIAGTGASKTITIAAAGTYNYTVTNAQGCTSGASANVVINPITSTTNPTYTLKVKNIAYVSNGLEFDVYMVHTNPSVTNFEYAAGQYFLTFNTAILNGGTGTYSIVSSALPTNMQPRSPSVAANVLRLAANVPPGAGMGYSSISTTTPGTLICKMRLTSSTTLSQIDPTLVWKDAGTAPITTINAYVGTTNTTVTTPATHSVDPYVPQGTIPTAPVVGTITQPTCALTTGSVVLNGLPATGTWTITRTPGAVTTTGTGVSKTITGIPAGTYTFKVANANGTSPASTNVVINTVSGAPTAPSVGTITQPTCALATGSVVLNGLPSGNWTINPGAIAGTGVSKTITGLTVGTKNYTVTNATGCTSAASANVVMVAPTGCGTPVYCTAASTNCAYFWIKGVTMNGRTNTSTGSTYTNFTAVTLNAVAGSFASMTLNPGSFTTAYAYSMEWRVWADFNKDGDFTDLGEALVVTSAMSNAATTVGAQIPAGVSGTTRMRVAMSYAPSGAPLSCGTFTYGEVEDYTINITTASALVADNSNATGALKNITTDGTSIENVITELAVYPNPANDVVNFTINLQDEVIQTVSVMDVLGKTMIQMNASTLNQNQIVLNNNIPTGIYFFQVMTDKGHYYMKKFSVAK